MSPGLMTPLIGRVAALGVGAQRLLLDRRQAALGVAGREAAVAEHAVVRLGLVHGAATSSSPSAGVMARSAIWYSQPMSSPVSSKIAIAPASTSRSKARADRRVGRDAARAVGAAADRADDQVAELDRDARDAERSAPGPRAPRRARPRSWRGCRRRAGRPACAPADRSPRRAAPARPGRSPRSRARRCSTAPTFGCVASRSSIIAA